MVKTHQTKRPRPMFLPFPKRTKRFYESFRKFIIRELRSSRVKKLIWAIVDEQGIDPSDVEVINVVSHPFGALRGEVAYASGKKRDLSETHYAGFYFAEKRRIDIYPPRLPLVATEKMAARQIWDNDDLHYYFFCFEPVGTLVHEYLHTKYKGEKTVQRLSRRYMANFEKETTGKTIYSHKKIPFFIWLDYFIMLYQDDLF